MRHLAASTDSVHEISPRLLLFLHGLLTESLPVHDFSVGMDLPFSKNSSTPLGRNASCLRRLRAGNDREKKDIVVMYCVVSGRAGTVEVKDVFVPER